MSFWLPSALTCVAFCATPEELRTVTIELVTCTVSPELRELSDDEKVWLLAFVRLSSARLPEVQEMVSVKPVATELIVKVTEEPLTDTADTASFSKTKGTPLWTSDTL